MVEADLRVEIMEDIIIEKGKIQIHGVEEKIHLEVKVEVGVEAEVEIKVGVEMVIEIDIKILMKEIKVIVERDILIKKIKIIVLMEFMMMDGVDVKKKKWKI